HRSAGGDVDVVGFARRDVVHARLREFFFIIGHSFQARVAFMGSLRFLTAGESHGPGLTIVVEGMPAGVPLTEDQIAVDLRRRQGGYGRGGRMLIEQDYAYLNAGVTRGLTTGAPIAMSIENKD